MDFKELDVVIGGAHGYAEHINSLGIHQQHIELRDNDGNLMKVWGACFAPNGDAFFALGQIPAYEDYTPHDICYIPGTYPYQFVTIIGRTNDTVELWRTDIDVGIVAQYTDLSFDDGWTHEVPLKIALGCDGDTVYYTDQGRTIFRFSLEDEAQLPIYDELAEDSPYIYAGIDVQNDNDVYVAITPIVSAGVGPRRDISIGGKDRIWVDQINETPIKVYKRSITTGLDTIEHEVSLDPDDTNDEVLCIASYYFTCASFQIPPFVQVVA